MEFKERCVLLQQKDFYLYILNKYDWAEDYCYYYVYVLYVERQFIPDILESISLEDREKYSEEKAYFYFAKYKKNTLNIATIIPTCNRPLAIRYLLNCIALSYRRYAADIIIYDSSDNEDTKKIVDKFRKNGYYNIFYKEYTGIFDGFSLDHKVIQAYKDFGLKYDYLWLCRDGLVPLIDDIYDKIVYYKQKNIGCIIVDTLSRTDGLEIERYYNTIEDCSDFLKEQADRLQTLGMLILSQKYSQMLIKEIPLSDATYSLWQMAAPFHAFINKPQKVVFTTKNVFAFNLNASKTHFWSKADKCLKQWAERWVSVIEAMPKEYDDVKKDCMMIYTVDFHPFAADIVWKMRSHGGLNYSLVVKYKDYLTKVTKTPLWYFYAVSIMPKFVARILQSIAYRNKETVKSFLRKINLWYMEDRSKSI